MSLTSYRAAPPRDELLSMGPRLRGGVTAARLAVLAKPCNSYEPDELPGCSTPRYGCNRLLVASTVVSDAVFFFLEDLAVTYSPAS